MEDHQERELNTQQMLWAKTMQISTLQALSQMTTGMPFHLLGKLKFPALLLWGGHVNCWSLLVKHVVVLKLNAYQLL